MRALISVYDKSGLVPFASGLRDLGWEIVASGGTSAALDDAGLEHVEVAELTGAPEMLGGRVKTLHPKIHGGILADRSVPEHMDDVRRRDIGLIDLVVCNLYPFGDDPSVEMIDVGGPTMVRAAAKNHAHVGVVVNPGDYEEVLSELRDSGSLSDETRRRLARAAFSHTASYDSAIVRWLDDGATLAPTIHLSLELAEELRYGENPHQRGARYREVGAKSWWDSVVQHGGSALSYLNLFDADAAWRLVGEVARPGEPAVVIVKHANPCGVALSGDLTRSYELALECDPVSAFGGVVALGGACTAEVARAVSAGPQADVIIASSWETEAVDTLTARRKATRLLEAPAHSQSQVHVRTLGDGFLVQDRDDFLSTRNDWRVATKAVPTLEQWRDIELAWRVCGRVSSNAIVVAQGGRALGVGAGQQSRVEAAEIAVRKAEGRASGGAAASDAFFPFRDGLDVLAGSGIAAVVQPGGSVRDDEVIAAADEHGLAMVLTGERHFRH